MKTIMVHLQLDCSNKTLLEFSADLARRLDAGLIGIATRQPLQFIYGDGYVSQDIFDEDQAATNREFLEAEREFFAVLSSRVNDLQWRSNVTFVPAAQYLAQQARSADLLVSGIDHNASLLDSTRHVDLGDLVMQAGRPVLIVPTSADRAAFDRIVVGWKDTRESRRAVSDALPLLRKAHYVSVVEIAEEPDLGDARRRVEDVTIWLKRHDVQAVPEVEVASGDNAAAIDLSAILKKQDADLVVAGAYGHSRLREWAFGGVTSDLLLRAERCALLSH